MFHVKHPPLDRVFMVVWIKNNLLIYLLKPDGVSPKPLLQEKPRCEARADETLSNSIDRRIFVKLCNSLLTLYILSKIEAPCGPAETGSPLRSDKLQGVFQM